MNAYAHDRGNGSNETIAELQERVFEAKRNHGPRKSLLEKMKWLRVLQLLEVKMSENSHEHRVGMTIHSLGQDIDDLWKLRMNNDTADLVMAERPRIRTLAIQLHALANDLLLAEAAE